MIYRSPEANALHLAVMNVIESHGNEQCFTVLRTVVNNASKAALTEKSLHGNSHLHDCLHLPFAIIIKQREKSVSISLRIFEILMARYFALKDEAVIQDALLNRNEYGMNILHCALQNCTLTNLEAVIEAIKKAFKKKYIYTTQFKMFLSEKNDKGFSPFSEALLAGHTLKLQAYLDLLDEARAQDVIKDHEYRDLLLNIDHEGNTTLDHAMFAGNVYNLKLYLARIDAAIKCKIISAEDYKYLLLNLNFLNFSTLQSAIKNYDIEILEVFVDALLKACEDKFMSGEELNMLLNLNGNLNYTPLLEAATAANTLKWQACSKLINTARTKYNLGTDGYSKLLIKKNQNGSSVLHIVLNKANILITNNYISSIETANDQQIINNDDYKKLLIGKNVAGYTPIHNAIISGNLLIVQSYLALLKRAVAKKIISQSEYNLVLIDKNDARYTPLHQAAASGNIEIVRALMTELDAAFCPAVIKQQLITKSIHSVIPCCPRTKPQAVAINAFLAAQREKYAQPYNTLQSYTANNNSVSSIVIQPPVRTTTQPITHQQRKARYS